MGRIEVVQFVDDVTGQAIEPDDLNRIKFSLDGQDYLLEVSSSTAGEFYRAMQKWVDAAQQPARTRGTKYPKRMARARELQHVREWAAKNGYKLASTGRIPNYVLDAYDEALLGRS
ncbi:histone-like nucleoid-structuring protein Lsr2 [Gordonia paraffinivorans]|uniref:histone-like nucleoid-structuring protein Lsr2 n=1 Tax=Gordonia paraffinivorans TaxID=175628 RepID=UPI001445370D|nr:Lsr2 family protein [Gordonia paraffinivorans]